MSPRPRIALICVGSELLRGKLNTHASTIARRLAAIQLELDEECTVGDNETKLSGLIRDAVHTHDVVIVTGGLGPTFDDVTREAASTATHRKLEFVPRLASEIRKKFQRAKLKSMPPANERQAYLLEGARDIRNSVGTAPGQWLEGNSYCLALLPGPPAEMEPMLDGFLIPRLAHMFNQGAHAEAHLHFSGVPESVIDDHVRPIIENETDADFTILAKPGLVDLDVFVHAQKKSQADTRLGKIVHAILGKTGKYFFGMNAENSLEQVVMNKFVAKKATLALAESCTGGLLAKHLTDIAGSSKYFLGGAVSYANSVKNALVGVPLATLRKHGAVSKPVALAMAKGIREHLGATCGLSITGIAGPEGGTSKKPVGLVFIGLASKRKAVCQEYRFRGSRSAIRQRSALAAMNLLREFLL